MTYCNHTSCSVWRKLDQSGARRPKMYHRVHSNDQEKRQFMRSVFRNLTIFAFVSEINVVTPLICSKSSLSINIIPTQKNLHTLACAFHK